MIAAHSPYSTTSGHHYGYNQRAETLNKQFFQSNYEKCYPAEENLRRQAVAASGFDRLGTRDLYVRSANVRTSKNDQLGLLGPHRISSYKAQRAGPDENLYAVEQDGKLADDLPNYTQHYSSGARAITGDALDGYVGGETRAANVEIKARWSSRKTAENRPGYRVPNYDTTYTDSHNNVKNLDKSTWMRNNTVDGYATDARSFEKPSQTKNDTLRPSNTQATHKSLWNLKPTLAGNSPFRESTYPDAAPGEYVKTNIMPQYRYAKNQEADGKPGLGMRNIGPPGRSRAVNNFWGQPNAHRYDQVPYQMNSRAVTR